MISKPTKQAMAETEFYIRFLEMMTTGYSGGTISAARGESVEMEYGYWASIHGHEMQADPNDSYAVAQCLARTRRAAVNMTGGHIGIWVDGRNGRNMLIFDVSQWFRDKDICLAFAKLNHQKAIWDCANSRPINVD